MRLAIVQQTVLRLEASWEYISSSVDVWYVLVDSFCFLLIFIKSVAEMNIATLPTELIELICLWAAESAFEESEVREVAGRILVRQLCARMVFCALLYPRCL